MKKEITWLLVAGLFLCAAMRVAAQENTVDESKVNTVSAELDKNSGEPGGKR